MRCPGASAATVHANCALWSGDGTYQKGTYRAVYELVFRQWMYFLMQASLLLWTLNNPKSSLSAFMGVEWGLWPASYWGYAQSDGPVAGLLKGDATM